MVESEFQKRCRFCEMGSTSDAMEAFWRGLGEPARNAGGFLEEVLLGLGRSWRAGGFPKAIL